jgi:GT2 family glycosyltransferase
MRGAALIVLAWNQWPTTRRCLDSLLATAPFAADLIVVDNGSTDETPQALRDYAGRVRIVTLPDNLGFVRGMNAGIAAARPDDDVVLLNNDLVFTQRDWLERLRDAAYARPENGVVGCRQIGPQEPPLLYSAGGFIEADDLWGQQTEAGMLERDVAQYTTTRRVQHVAFALAYLRRDCLARIGGLDEIFHSYFEDTDYCLRAADAGIATVNAGAVTLRHEQHGSTQDDGGFRQRLWAASRAAFAARWQSRLRDEQRGNVLWQGATRASPAHAHLARALVRRLDARGLRMSFELVADEFADAQDFRLDLAARRAGRRPATPRSSAPTARTSRARTRRRIALAFCDWARVPAAWVDGANALDLLLVPDTFQRDAFAASGVRTPIDVLPIGVDADYCHLRVPATRDPQGRFTFLAVVDDFARDAPDVLVDAFRAAFADDDGVALLIHVRAGADAFATAQSLAAQRGSDARIRILADWTFPWHQRALFLRGGDAYIAARRGGGYDPFAADALACGLQLVASDFGSSGGLAREHGIAIETRHVDDARNHLPWAEPEFDALVAALREARARQRSQRDIEDAAALFASSHDIETSADALATRVSELATLAPPRAKPTPHRPVDLARAPSGQLVVLGMHRSGTSSVAGLLARFGVHVGPSDDLLVGPDNPKGHYESGRLHGACLRRLAAAGGDWKQPPMHVPADAVDAFRREVGALVDEFDAHRPWLIKEPRLCLVARELLPLLTRPVFVHVVRDAQAVAASLAARDAMDGDAALALWERYTRDAFAASAGWPRVLVDYDALCAEPLRVSRALFAELQTLGIAGLAWPGDDIVLDWIEPQARKPAPFAATMTAAQRTLQAAISDRSILDARDERALRGAA